MPESLGAMLWVTFFDDVEFRDATGAVSLGAVDEYALLNGRLSYPLRLSRADGSLFIQGFNLLDHDHRENPAGDSYGLILVGGLDLAF